MSAVLTGGVAGLLGEHVFTAVVVRQATDVQADSSENSQCSSRRRSLEQNLDSGHILSQRKARHVSRGDGEQPTDAAEYNRFRMVRHQVSISVYIWVYHTRQIDVAASGGGRSPPPFGLSIFSSKSTFGYKETLIFFK